MDIKQGKMGHDLTTFTGVTKKGQQWLLDNVTEVSVRITIHNDYATDMVRTMIDADLVVE